MAPPRNGFTLVELVTALALAALLATLLLSGLTGWAERERVRSSTRLLVVDLHFARGTALRTGHPTALRFDRVDGAPRCYAPSYRVVVLGREEVVVRTRHLPLRAGSCLDVGARREVVFRAHGLLRGGDNRKIRVRGGLAGDSLVISSIGRVYRY